MGVVQALSGEPGIAAAGSFLLHGLSLPLGWLFYGFFPELTVGSTRLGPAATGGSPYLRSISEFRKS